MLAMCAATAAIELAASARSTAARIWVKVC